VIRVQEPIGMGLRLCPPLDEQALDALKLTHVAGHQGHPKAKGVRRNQKIVAPDGQPRPLQLRPDPALPTSRLGIERNDFQR